MQGRKFRMLSGNWVEATVTLRTAATAHSYRERKLILGIIVTAFHGSIRLILKTTYKAGTVSQKKMRQCIRDLSEATWSTRSRAELCPGCVVSQAVESHSLWSKLRG